MTAATQQKRHISTGRAGEIRTEVSRRKAKAQELANGKPPCTTGRTAHHIVLPEPNGSPLLTGACKFCGYQNEYRSSEDFAVDAFTLKDKRP